METGPGTSAKVEPSPRPARLTDPLRLRRSERTARRVSTAPKRVFSEFEQVGQHDLLKGTGAAGRAAVTAARRVAEDVRP